ncbi:hypothetical protein HPB48_021457 [Haemaphysalis longicornis]|uniref:EGF-like domain-containing protein n=1 Tax=Haemaphysalis longicornis TaxID=44386 RepID=A0A9J6G8U2_HAELO|nr:hypothetical protein HPB48_021457 [Haemaphysalis longicornis]
MPGLTSPGGRRRRRYLHESCRRRKDAEVDLKMAPPVATIKRRQHTGRVSSSVPCDLFNRTEWSCWLLRGLNQTRLLLRLALADDALDRRRVRVAWRRKHKIRGQNLYAVEDIEASGTSYGTFLSHDPLSLELNPLTDRDRFLNKIEALVYVRRTGSADVVGDVVDSNSAALGELLYGELTYVIDSQPTVLVSSVSPPPDLPLSLLPCASCNRVRSTQVVNPSPGSRELALALEDYLTLPPQGALIECKRRLSRVRFSSCKSNVRLLAGGRLALVTLSTGKTPLSMSCTPCTPRTPILRDAPLPRAVPGEWNATQDTMETTTPKDTVINLAVKVDSKPDPLGESGDDYTIVQTNLSVSSGADRGLAPQGRPKAQGGIAQHFRPGAHPEKAKPKPKPASVAAFENNLCFRLVPGENGEARVVPCDLFPTSSTMQSPRKPPTSAIPTRQPARWRGHRHRGSSALRRGQRPRGGGGGGGKASRLSEEERLRTDVDGLQPCLADDDCNLHASCVVALGSTKGRCACDRGYLGNGLFCWEAFFLR